MTYVGESWEAKRQHGVMTLINNSINHHALPQQDSDETTLVLPEYNVKILNKYIPFTR